MTCPYHPGSVMGTDGTPLAGKCWDCEGRPPWVCTACGHRLPCTHLGKGVVHVALDAEEAEARQRVVRAAEAWAKDYGSRDNFERALDGYCRAARSAWSRRQAKAREN